MKFLPVLFIFFDVTPPEPFKYGATGTAAGIAFGLFLSAVAAASFLLFRNKLAARVRILMALIFLSTGIIGGVFIWRAAAAYDAEAERNRQPYRRIPNPNLENEEIPAANNNSNGNKPKSR